MLEKLQHKNIVSILAKISAPAFPHQWRIIMEKAESNLFTYLRSQPFLPYADKLSIALQILQALIHMHERGMVHRDIAARNVLVFRGSQSLGRIFKLTDFGLSRETDEDSNVYKQMHFGKYVEPRNAIFIAISDHARQTSSSTRP
jgi:serine/threonine protein kinase